MTKIELERALEERCVARVEALGGMAIKLLVPGVRGFPDRGCFLPGRPLLPRQTFFLEFKRLKTGRVSAQQHMWCFKLTELGFGVYMIDTDAQFEDALAREMSR